MVVAIAYIIVHLPLCFAHIAHIYALPTLRIDAREHVRSRELQKKFRNVAQRPL